MVQEEIISALSVKLWQLLHISSGCLEGLSALWHSTQLTAPRCDLCGLGSRFFVFFGEGVVALVALEALALRGPAGFGGKLAAVDFGEGLFSSAGAEGKARAEVATSAMVMVWS